MLRARTNLRSILFALLMLCRTLSAQVAGARLEGIVQDQSGAVVSGAKVSVVNARTQEQAAISTSSEGLFIFPSLQPGLYTLSVEAAGFHQAVVRNLELNVGLTVAHKVILEVGEMTESIEVQAPEERVQVADAQIQHTVKLIEIDTLPQAGRSPMALTLYTTGIQIDPADPSMSRVNGTRMGSTSTRLDGVDVNDNSAPRFLLSNVANNTDSVEESRIITSGGKAEYGRQAGAQIELITRSGTNNWHGSLYEYNRNTALNANTFFGNSSGLPKPKYIQNTFGGSLGGPIRHNRTFIFGNYQGRRNVQEVVRNRLVLTSEAKAGLFRWKPPGSSEIRTFDIVATDPRGKGIDPSVSELLKLLPYPNNNDIGDGLNTAGFRFNNPSITSIDDIPDDQFTIKADHTLWSGHHIFFRYTWSHPTFIDVPSNGDARFPGQPQATQGGRRWGLSIGSDWAINPHLVNELRVGYKPPYNYDFRRPARLMGPMLLSNSWTDPLNPDFASRWKLSMLQITDNLTIVRGKHTFQFGAEGRFTNDWRSSDAGIWPDVRFDVNYNNAPSAITGPYGAVISSVDRQSFEKLYNDLLGRMSLVTQTFYSDLKNFQPAGTPRINDYRYREFSCFFQDDWKIHPRLALNLGLRYEFSGVPVEVNGNQGIVDKAALISSSARFADLAIQPGGRLYNNDLNNFAPRIGLAWDPTGNSKTVIRAGWGLFYDRLVGQTINFVAANTPGFALQVPVYPNSAGTDIRVSDGIPLPRAPAAPQLRLPATRSTDLALFSPNLRTGYVQHYNLTFQWEILRNTVIEAGYVGSHGVKLFMDVNLNQPRIHEDFLNSFRELQAFQNSGTPVPASNTLARIFGSPYNAISVLGALNVSQGTAGSAADSMDRLRYNLYARAGVSDFYLRNFPQFNRVIIGTNDGRSYYDSFQLSLRRQTGVLKFAANYTFSKSMDNISVDGRSFTSPIDNFNLRLNRARSDYDIPHTFNLSMAYTLPFGKERYFAINVPRWADSLINGWDIGLLTFWQSGRTISFQSGRATGPTTGSSFVNYSGDRNIGGVMRKNDGIYWFTEEEISRFSFPAAGEIGSGGRNAFRGPRFFNADLALIKKFDIHDQHVITFRAEAYNLFNNVNFGTPNLNLSTPATFGKISTTVGNPRFLQIALRYDF
jgi:hypothetical protein